MTDFVKTISNSTTLWGISPTERWGSSTAGAMIWGTDNWLYGNEDLPAGVQKAVQDAVTVLGGQMYFVFTKVIADPEVIASDIIKQAQKVIASTFVVTGADLFRYIGKSIVEPFSVTGSVGFAVDKVISEPVVWDSTQHLFTSHYLAVQTCVVSGDMSSEKIGDAAGYTRLFPAGKDDGENRVWDSFSLVASSSASWTSGTGTSTTWSEV